VAKTGKAVEGERNDKRGKENLMKGMTELFVQTHQNSLLI